MSLLPDLPFWAELLVFAAAAVTIWVAGIFLSNYTDVLAERIHLGQALGGLILLAVATNLPEIAITYTAAASGHLDIAVSNILGGIAIQTALLAALDAFGVRQRRPLTYQAASLTLVIEGAVVLAVLVAVVMGTQLPDTLIKFRLTPDVVLITVIWVTGLVLVQRGGGALPWSNCGEAPDSQPEPRGHSRTKTADKAADKGVSTTKVLVVFSVAALATLVAGALAEESGSAAADHVGLSGVVFGATVLAAATALPELSTGLTAVRMGDYKLAFGDIFGGNAFLPVLFLLAVLVSGKPVLPHAHATDIYLTGLAALLTVIYVAGLVFRPAKQHFRLGVDSITVVVLYVLGIVGLVALPA
ncbi:MAG: cation:H+ antiporter [Frankiaceae bacterium]|nr:cation:H+ antiporter [Frankiaceae bacterium]